MTKKENLIPQVKQYCVVCDEELKNPKIGIMTCSKPQCKKDYKSFKRVLYENSERFRIWKEEYKLKRKAKTKKYLNSKLLHNDMKEKEVL